MSGQVNNYLPMKKFIFIVLQFFALPIFLTDCKFLTCQDVMEFYKKENLLVMNCLQKDCNPSGACTLYWKNEILYMQLYLP